jgi:hypothetical protein
MMKYIKYAALPLFFIIIAFFIFKGENKKNIDQYQCYFFTSDWVDSNEYNYDLIPINHIKIMNNNIYWNDVIISEKELDQYIAAQKSFDPQPLIIFDYRISRKNCPFASKILKKVNSGMDCKNSKLCGFGSREDWDRIPPSNSTAGPIE